MNFKLIFSLLLFLGVSHILSAQGSYKTLLYEGNKEFDKKNYEASSSKFLEAAQSNDKDFTAHYNLGNSLYKKKMYEEAKTEFQKAENLAKNKNDKAAAQYNLGNSLMQTEKADQAADMYKKALKNDPYNESIRKNYEIAKLKNKEKENKQQGEQGEQQNKNNEGGQDNKGDQKANQPNGASNDQQQKGEGANDKKSQQQPKENGNKIPKDIENAILNKVQDKEKETARRILNKNANSIPQSNEKDW